LASDPSNGAYHDSLGWVYFKLNRIDHAARHVGKAARQFSDNPEIIQHIESIRKKAGK